MHDLSNHVFRSLDSDVRVGVARIQDDADCHCHELRQRKLLAPMLRQFRSVQDAHRKVYSEHFFLQLFYGRISKDEREIAFP
jgi:hypothetical protein